MSASYLERLEAFTKVFKGDKYVSEALAKIGDTGVSDNGLKFSDLSKDVQAAYEGLRYLLNHYEFLAQAIRAKDLDEHLIYQSFSRFMQNLEKKGYFVIKTAQERDKTYYEGLIWLLKKWQLSSFDDLSSKTEPEKALGMMVPEKLEARKKKPKA
jgi:hypothetical protein